MKTLCIKMPNFLKMTSFKSINNFYCKYCVGGSLDELPLMNIQVLPFNLDHAKRTVNFKSMFLAEKNATFASDSDKSILYFVTSDSRSLNTHKLLSKRIKPKFEIIDIHIPYDQQFGILDLK